MVIVDFTDDFEKSVKKIRDASLLERTKKHIKKIVDNPETGKPMRYARKGTREVYVPPFRISYAYFKEQDRILFINIYHKDEQ
jgi:mRNA-degrading endonuclease RelE of RelBE toxin-antitoxin system